MTKRSNHTFKKYQKELKRKQKAQEKLDRRQRKKDHSIDDNHEKKNTD